MACLRAVPSRWQAERRWRSTQGTYSTYRQPRRTAFRRGIRSRSFIRWTDICAGASADARRQAQAIQATLDWEVFGPTCPSPQHIQDGPNEIIDDRSDRVHGIRRGWQFAD